MILYAERAVDQTLYFSSAFVCENIEYRFDVVTMSRLFESLQSTPICLEKFSVWKAIL